MSNYRNTVQSCVAKFLRNKHRDEFMALNPWMDITTAAVVFFRRHTSHRANYCPKLSEFENYGEYWDMFEDSPKWWQLPVSQKQCAGIKPATLARYYVIIQEVIAAEMAEDFALHDLVQDVP